MIYSLFSEIAFSQVREDPLIEFQLIEQLAQQQKAPLRVLLIASGGCTALSLLAHSAIDQIAAIDVNPAQLHLVEFRRQALLHLSLKDQLDLIGATGENNFKERLKIYEKLQFYLPEATQKFWNSRLEQIAFGLNRVGRFEQLFRDLSAGLARQGINPLKIPLTAAKSPQWREIFEQVFERNKLAQIFGDAAVNYSMDRSFGEHFADVFAQALGRFTPKQNYFLTQVFSDRYGEGVDGVPLYLQEKNQKLIRSLGTDRLKLHQGTFIEQMVKLSNEEKFDFIQFSNISDWMPLSELNAMLRLAINALKKGGILLGRRLNGDHHLGSIMAQHLSVDPHLNASLLASDRSFFYQEVVVGFHL